ncbi:MAG TPA: carbonic anhydrase [Candidatus Tyrphobacter sp.]
MKGNGERGANALAMRRLPPLAQESLNRLLAGNERMRAGEALAVPHQTRRAELAHGQQPFAAVLACIDSRVVPEIVFHQPVGAILASRVPGSTLEDAALATFEFAISSLGVPLVFVLGHTSCAAMRLAIEFMRDGAKPPGQMLRSARALAVPAKRAYHLDGDWVDNAAAENVRLVIASLPRRSRTIRQALKRNDLGLAGGVYDLRSGDVRLV